MVHAPAREPGCALELVHVDITAMTFNEKWEVLGYVTLMDRGVQDPADPENRALVRPRACAMGGTAVAVSISSTTSNGLQEGSTVGYMVLRPKALTSESTTF